MNGARYFLRRAWQNLMRSGQTGTAALLCIAFGVMSLVALGLLADAISRVVVTDPRALLGADLSLTRADGAAISPTQIQFLGSLRAEGALDAVETVAYASNLMFRTPASGEMHFAASGLGVEPAHYPLVGAFTIGEPRGASFAELMPAAGDVVVSRDLALDNALRVGDPLILSDLGGGAPVTAHVRGILWDSPSHQGGRFYYNQRTAELLAGGKPALNVALATTTNASVSARLEAAGWDVTTAEDMGAGQKRGGDLMQLLLNGAGLLGLLVGGIGIANTMQVLLSRRRREIAIWKTLGYREPHLILMFLLEALMLGGAGSLLGAAAGVGISSAVLGLFARTTDLLFTWAFSPTVVALGLIVGVAMTVIFALWAIVRGSHVRPMALLRSEPVDAARVPRVQTLLLALGLTLPLLAVASLVVGSLAWGAAVLAFGLAGILVLGVLLSALGWLAARLLPVRAAPLLNISQNSIRRRGMSLVFAMIALFVGIFALGLGVAFTQNARHALDARTIQIAGYNAVVLVPPDQSAAVERVLRGRNLPFASTAEIAVRSIRSLDARAAAVTPRVFGVTEPYNYKLTGAPWGSDAAGVYVEASSQLAAGDSVEVTGLNGARREFPVVGTFRSASNPATMWQDFGLLMPASLSRELGAPATLRYFVDVPDGAAERIAALGMALPNATVINLAAYANRFAGAYRNLFVLAVAMSALALLAGALLVANSVSLAMLDRRFEIGILKAVGYSRGAVWLTLGVEYGVLGLVATLAGLAAVQVLLLLLGLSNPLAAQLLFLDPLAALGIVSIGLGLVLVTVLVVTWSPTRAEPMSVLRGAA